MNENIEKRLGEIATLKQEYRSKLENDEKLDLDKIECEIKKLNDEEVELRSKIETANKINESTKETRSIEKPEVNKMNENILASVEYRSAFRDFVVKGTPIPKEFRDAFAPLTHSGSTSAGAAIPVTTLDMVAQKLEDYGKILPLVTRTSYQTGLAIPVNAISYDATWVAETNPTNTDKQIELSSVVFNAYLLKMSFVLSLQVETMSIDAFESWMAERIASGITRALEKAIINGTGNNQLTGILTKANEAAELAKLTAEGRVINSTALDYDTIMGIEKAIPSAYDGLDILLMNKKTFVALRGVKDDNKRPVVESLDIMNKSLFGRQVVFTDQLPAFDAASAGDAVVIAYNMKDYYLNIAHEVQFKDYYDEIFEQTIKKGLVLADGKPVLLDSLVVVNKA